LRTDDEIARAGARLLELLGAKNVLLTRGEKGMTLFESNGDTTHIKTIADVIQDVSGAGDTVISTLTVALAAGAGIKDACRLANCAAGIVVAQVGIVPVTPQQLIDAALRLPLTEQ
jgi:D-beta-D-heptose 7-phosphate kinase/D-beta-D-heptose 1-phosphate adenosyltransferase